MVCPATRDDQVKSVFLMDLNISLLIRNQEESHLKRTIGKSWASWRYLLYLSQFKVCGLQESDGTVFINPARWCRWMLSGGEKWGETGSGGGRFGPRWPPSWKRQHLSSTSSRIFENLPENAPEYSHRKLAIASFLVTAVRKNIGGLLSCLVSLSSSVPELTRHGLERGLHVNP